MIENTETEKESIPTKAKRLYTTKAYESCIVYISKKINNQTLSEPELGLLFFILGNAYAMLDKFIESVVYFKKSIKYSSDNARVYFCLANTYRELKKFQLSIIAYEKAISLNPKEKNYYLNLGGVYRTLDRNQDAINIYKKMLELQPDFQMGYRNLVQCQVYNTIDNPDFSAVSKLINDESISESNKMHCHFALGKIWHDCQHYDKAFEHVMAANVIKAKENPYNKDKTEKFINDTIACFSPEFFLNTPKGLGTQQPVFIIGLPRSGKTLLQKILACHPAISGLDEFGLIDAMVNQLKKQKKINTESMPVQKIFTKDILLSMGRHYLDMANERCNYSHMRIIDTTPYYFKYLGYIHMIFPNAKIIYLKRDPLDHCLQIFLKYFAEGNYYAYNLLDLAHYYNYYKKIMTHWELVLPSDMLEISYEAIVKSPESVGCMLLQHLEIEGHSDFQSNLNKIKFNSNEIGQWQHYEPYLQDLIRLI